MDIDFHLRARAVIISDGAVLATRVRGMGYSFLPGGHVESGESIPSALLREIKEELGKEATIEHYLGAIEQSWIKEEKARQQEVNHIFACSIPDITSEEPVSGLEAHFEFFWLRPEEFEEKNLLPFSLRPLLKKYIAGDTSIWWASNSLD